MTEKLPSGVTEAATMKQRDNWKLIAGRTGIHWPDLDEDLPLKGFLAGAE